jgi:hypothetical protein
MGKILVVLILVVSLLLGGLLVYDSATSTNWKEDNYQKTGEITAARANTAAEQEKNRKLKALLDAVTTERDKLKSDLDDQKKKYTKDLNDEKDSTTAQKNEATKSKATADAAVAEAVRLRKEVALHLAAVEERDKTILAQEGKLKNLLDRAVSAENANNSLKARNTYLLDQLENTTKKLVKMEAGVGGPAATVRSANAKNPPTVYVRGIVTNILKDNGLVEVSIGSDQGVNVDNTLEVYRLKPRPEYLGTIKILDAHHHKAVGRLMKAQGARRSAIVKGDEVASRILAR